MRRTQMIAVAVAMFGVLVLSGATRGRSLRENVAILERRVAALERRMDDLHGREDEAIAAGRRVKPGQAARDGDTFRVLNVEAKPLKKDFDDTTLSWKVVIASSANQRLYIEVKFLDKEQMQLDYTNEIVQIEAGVTRTFTGTTIIDNALAKKIDRVIAEVTWMP